MESTGILRLYPKAQKGAVTALPLHYNLLIVLLDLARGP
jgi:hypothetical protein